MTGKEKMMKEEKQKIISSIIHDYRLRTTDSRLTLTFINIKASQINRFNLFL